MAVTREATIGNVFALQCPSCTLEATLASSASAQPAKPCNAEGGSSNISFRGLHSFYEELSSQISQELSKRQKPRSMIRLIFQHFNFNSRHLQ